MDHSSLCVALYRSNMSYALAHPVSPLSDAALSIFCFGILYFHFASGIGVSQSVIQNASRQFCCDRVLDLSATASSIRRLLQVHKIR